MKLTLRQIAAATAAGSVALCAFALGWWGNDDAGTRVLTRTTAPEWALPKPVVSDLSGYAKILAQRPPFGAPGEQADKTAAAAPAAAPVTAGPMQWRVGGIVTTGTSQYVVVLIRRPGENITQSEVRHPGEQLPDGSIIRTVEASHVTIDRQGAIVRIKMFAQN